MTNTELVRQLNTASIQCDEMRLRDFGYLMKCAADALEQLEKESRKWELDAHANKLERDNYLKKSQELAAAWCDALDKVRVWIPVTERLPDKYDDVIFHYERTGLSGSKYRETDVTTLAEVTRYYKPLYWMPIPEPPKEVEE